jgi:hypothetical protein
MLPSHNGRILAPRTDAIAKWQEHVTVDDYNRMVDNARELEAELSVTPSHGGQRKLEDMPTDAVIKAICAWMEWDYADKAMRAEASELYHAIRRASSIAESASGHREKP